MTADPSLIEPIVGAGWARWIGWPRRSDELAQMARRAIRHAGAGCVRPRGPSPLRALLAGEHARHGR